MCANHIHEPTAASLIFTNPDFHVIICRKCSHAVHRGHITRHLTGTHHRIPLSVAQYIQTTVQQWDHIHREPDFTSWPTVLDEPIPGITVYEDGLLCCKCEAFVARHMKGLKQHWHDQHQWSPGSQRGRPTASNKSMIEMEVTRNSRSVACQRIFIQGNGSRYIWVRSPHGEVEPESAASPVGDALKQHLRALMHQVRVTRQTVIQAGDIDEATPWLNRTGWVRYLQGISVPALVQSIERPDEEAEGDEGVAFAIWTAMDRLARVSQRVAKASGFLIRIEAARTKQGESPFEPLQAYMHESEVRDHVDPWQRILMFFVRTQAAHDWQSPPYQFTERQQRKWDTLWRYAHAEYQQPTDPAADPDAEPFELRPIELALMEFCIDLLRQKTRNDEYGCALVCASAVLGRHSHGWDSPVNYPPKISSIVKIARFMVLHKALRLDPDSVEIRRQLAGVGGGQYFHGDMIDLDADYIDEVDDEGYGSSPTRPGPDPIIDSPMFTTPQRSSRYSSVLGSITQERRRHPKRTFLEWLKYLMDAFMVRGTNSPVQWLLDLRTYRRKIFMNTPTEGHISWKSHDELLYKQIHFTMADFRGLVHGLVHQMQEHLHERLLFGNSGAIPTIAMQDLYDDPTQRAPGWNFVHDRRTLWPVDGETWLLDRVFDEGLLRRQFVDSTGESFRMSTIDRYFREVVRFRELLAVAVHISAGQPSRAPELLSIRYRNSDRAVRNVFIEDGMVVLVSRYHKGFYATNDVKVIHRYLPREIGELVVQYIWLVTPFVEQLEAYQRRYRDQFPAPAREEYIWSPDPHNGREWTGERFRKVFEAATAAGLAHQKINLQSYRDIAIAISRQFLRRTSQFPSNVQDGESPIDATQVASPDDEGAMDQDEFMGHITDLQASHSSHMAGLVYAREIMENTGSTAFRRQKFRESSQDWHQFLGFISAHATNQQAIALGKRKRQPWQSGVEEQRDERRYQLWGADMGQAFRDMTGQSEATFRGIQGPALQAIQTGVSPIVAVMPTGGGKSLLFMLPAWVSKGGLTVVVVPLIALRHDMQQRCAQLGIACEAWDRERPPDDASIVLVTPEATRGETFQTFLNRQRLLQRLDRIVIDECHVVLNNQDRFRPQLQESGDLRSARTQMVLLTATLPPSEEKRLWYRMGWPMDQVVTYRSRTHRPNVAYRVWTPEISHECDNWFQWVQMEAVTQFIRERIQRASPGRVVVYGSITSHIQTMAQQLGCEAYHAKAADKEGILERFRSQPGAVITATNALGMGIDIPDIRSVIHLGRPRTLMDYAQESGRAGRDGQRSEAIIIQPEGQYVGREVVPRWMQEISHGDHQLYKGNPDLDLPIPQPLFITFLISIDRANLNKYNTTL